MNTPTIAIAPAATYTAREAEVPNANWYSGVEASSLNAPGLGIAVGGGSVEPERLEAWTLLDQFGNARTPQTSQPIGGVGLTATTDWPESGGVVKTTGAPAIEVVTASDEGDGKYTVWGAAALETLAGGWVGTE